MNRRGRNLKIFLMDGSASGPFLNWIFGHFFS